MKAFIRQIKCFDSEPPGHEVRLIFAKLSTSSHKLRIRFEWELAMLIGLRSVKSQGRGEECPLSTINNTRTVSGLGMSMTNSEAIDFLGIRACVDGSSVLCMLLFSHDKLFPCALSPQHCE